eukprot:IDg15169t1
MKTVRGENFQVRKLSAYELNVFCDNRFDFFEGPIFDSATPYIITLTEEALILCGGDDAACLK